MILENCEISKIKNKIGECNPVYSRSFIIFHNSFAPNVSSRTVRNISEKMKSLNFDDFVLLHNFRDERRIECNNVKITILGDAFDNAGQDLEEALDGVLRNPSAYEVGKLDLGGRFAAVISFDGNVIVFNDPLGSRSISYLNDGHFVVSSHATLIRRFYRLPILKGMREIISSPRYKSRTVNYLPGDYTVYKNVLRLTPNHIIDSRYPTSVRCWPQDAPIDNGVSFLYDKMDMCLNSFFKYVNRKYSPVLPVTGGVDSRSLISFAYGKTDLDLYTWTDFNYSSKESGAIREIVSLTGANHFTVSASQISSRIGKDQLEEMAFLTSLNSGMTSNDLNRTLVVGGVERQLRSQRNLPVVTVIGYGGEIIRGFHMRNKRENLPFPNANTLTGMYGLGSGKLPPDREFSHFCTHAFRDFQSRTMFTEISLKGWSPYDVFYWEHRMGIWGATTLDAMDVGGYTMVALNSRKVFEAAISLPNTLRMDKTILMNYVKRNNQDLASIPLY